MIGESGAEESDGVDMDTCIGIGSDAEGDGAADSVDVCHEREGPFWTDDGARHRLHTNRLDNVVVGPIGIVSERHGEDGMDKRDRCQKTVYDRGEDKDGD